MKNMVKKWKKQIALLLILMCCFSPLTAYANTETITTNSLPSFEYTENGIDFKCFYTQTGNGFEAFLYQLEGNEQVLVEHFFITSDEKGNIFYNDTLVVRPAQLPKNDADGIMPVELYDKQYFHGEVDYNLSMSLASITLAIFQAFFNVNPLISAATDAFFSAAEYIVDNNIPSAYYSAITQLETFPTNVPPEYQGAITKTTYEYRVYRSTNFIDSHQIGKTVNDVHYGMPE